MPGDRLTVEVDYLDGGGPAVPARELDFRGTAQAHGRKIATATFFAQQVLAQAAGLEV